MKLVALIDGEKPEGAPPRQRAPRFRGPAEREEPGARAPVVRDRPAPRIRALPENSTERLAELGPFRAAQIADLTQLVRSPRPVGMGVVIHAVKGVADAMRSRERNPAPYVRGALLLLAAECIEWAAQLERDERIVVRRAA